MKRVAGAIAFSLEGGVAAALLWAFDALLGAFDALITWRRNAMLSQDRGNSHEPGGPVYVTEGLAQGRFCTVVLQGSIFWLILSLWPPITQLSMLLS